MPPPTDFPDTHAELYDLLQEMFGVGTYDDVVGSEAWHRARMVEIMKLKGLCRRRRATVKHVAVAAWYAKERGLPIQHSARLYGLIPEAMRCYNMQVKASTADAEAHELQTAVNTAMRLGQDVWAERLIRSEGSNTREVLDEWQRNQ